MKKKLVIKGKEIIGVFAAEKAGLLFVPKRKGLSVYRTETYEPVCECSLDDITRMCFDERQEHVYMVDCVRDVFGFKISSLLQGNVEPDFKLSNFELLNDCRELIWLDEDHLLFNGEHKNSIVHISEKKIVPIDLLEMGTDTMAYSTVYDREAGKIIYYTNGDPCKVHISAFTDGELRIPLEFIELKKKDYVSVYVQGFEIRMEKMLGTLFKKQSHFQIVGHGMKRNGTFEDKKMRKAIDQIDFIQIEKIGETLVVISTNFSLIFVSMKEDEPAFTIIDTEYMSFSVIHETELLCNLDDHGIYLLTELV